MDDRNIPPPDHGDPNIADAASLFRDAPGPAPTPKKTPPPTASEVGDGFDMEDLPDDLPKRPSSAPVERPIGTKAPRAERPPSDPKSAGLEPSAAVEQVWSRGSEWGGTLTLLVFAVLGVLGLLFVLLTSEMFGLAFLTLLLSVPFLVLVAYPILITLERPVRITPEQAVNDYFASLSHHFPHYRRMWLLLSTSGRVSGSFASFEGFRNYWKGRLTELRAGRSGSFTPLKFQVEDFRSEKSAGLSRIDANYTVIVSVRGRQDEGPVGTIKVAMSLVKGPDRMWYLNKGTLP